MTTLFQNAGHTSEPNLSHPLKSSAEVSQDGNDADLSTDNRTYNAKSTRGEDASSTLFPTLRRLPMPTSSPNLCTSTSRRKRDIESESVAAGPKTRQAEMPSMKVDESAGTLATSVRHPPQNSASTGVIESGTKEIRLQEEEDAKHLQTTSDGEEACEKTLKSSPSQLVELVSTPSSLPRGLPPSNSCPSSSQNSSQTATSRESHSQSSSGVKRRSSPVIEKPGTENHSRNGAVMALTNINKATHRSLSSDTKIFEHASNPNTMSYAVPAPGSIGSRAAGNAIDSFGNPVSTDPAQVPDRLELGSPLMCTLTDEIDTKSSVEESCPSPIPTSMPLPPFSLPTFLHLELSTDKPSPLYIYRSKTSEVPYELSRVKIERLLNFLLLPPQLEQVLLFGTLACLDAFLYSFTILPLRFFIALSILAQSLGQNLAKESQYIAAFTYSGAFRVWKRKRRDSINSNNGSFSQNESFHHLKDKSVPTASSPSSSINVKASKTNHPHQEPPAMQGKNSGGTRPRFQSTPSTLLLEQKADLLKGFLLILSCTILMYFDASRMYHGIRGQAAIKLYVIYNVLEVSHKA